MQGPIKMRFHHGKALTEFSFNLIMILYDDICEKVYFIGFWHVSGGHLGFGE